MTRISSLVAVSTFVITLTAVETSHAQEAVVPAPEGGQTDVGEAVPEEAGEDSAEFQEQEEQPGVGLPQRPSSPRVAETDESPGPPPAPPVEPEQAQSDDGPTVELPENWDEEEEDQENGEANNARFRLNLGGYGGEEDEDEEEDPPYQLTLAGYGETEFHAGFNGDSYFDHHRFVMFVRAQIASFITVSTEIEWEHGGTPRKRDGSLNVGEVLLEYAVADVRIFEWLQIRAGILLVPFGVFNIRHDAPERELGPRPMVLKTIVPSTWFETGAGLFGRFRFGNDMELNYEAYFINGFDTKIYDVVGLRAARGSLGEDNNSNKSFVMHLGFRPLYQLEVGASFYRGAYDPAGERRVHMFGADIAANIGPVELLGEFAFVLNDPGFDEGWPGATRDPIPEQMLGYFLQVNYHFMPRFLRKIMTGQMRREASFTASVRYGEIDTDRSVTTAGDATRITLGLNFRPVRAFVFKNDFLFQANGGDGSLKRFFNRGYSPEIKYVASIAFAF
jgi:hypothetical protein